MKVLAFRPRRPSRAEILRLVARRRPALAGMTRRASPAGSRAKVGAAAEAIPPATPGNAGPIGRPAVTITAHYRTYLGCGGGLAGGQSLPDDGVHPLLDGFRQDRHALDGHESLIDLPEADFVVAHRLLFVTIPFPRPSTERWQPRRTPRALARACEPRSPAACPGRETRAPAGRTRKSCRWCACTPR